MTPCKEHKKVYQNTSRAVFSPSYNWICSECMTTGIDKNQDYDPEPSYEKLMRNKNKFLIEEI